MEEDREQKQSILFTVRVWPGDSGQTPAIWRGKVQDVSTGAWRNFHNWDALVAFMQKQVEAINAENNLG